jgi:hypothetical protein
VSVDERLDVDADARAPELGVPAVEYTGVEQLSPNQLMRIIARDVSKDRSPSRRARRAKRPRRG